MLAGPVCPAFLYFSAWPHRSHLWLRFKLVGGQTSPLGQNPFSGNPEISGIPSGNPEKRSACNGGATCIIIQILRERVSIRKRSDMGSSYPTRISRFSNRSGNPFLPANFWFFRPLKSSSGKGFRFMQDLGSINRKPHKARENTDALLGGLVRGDLLEPHPYNLFPEQDHGAEPGAPGLDDISFLGAGDEALSPGASP